MKRYVVIMLLLMVSIVACQRDVVKVSSPKIPEYTNPYAISPEDAIAYLMQTLEGEETRSASSLNVESVDVVKSVYCASM